MSQDKKLTIKQIDNIFRSRSPQKLVLPPKLPQRLPHGPAGNLAQPNNSNIIGIIAVIKYFIKQISIHRHQEMCDELEYLLKKAKNEKVTKKEELPMYSNSSLCGLVTYLRTFYEDYLKCVEFCDWLKEKAERQ